VKTRILTELFQNMFSTLSVFISVVGMAIGTRLWAHSFVRMCTMCKYTNTHVLAKSMRGRLNRRSRKYASKNFALIVHTHMETMTGRAREDRCRQRCNWSNHSRVVVRGGAPPRRGAEARKYALVCLHTPRNVGGKAIRAAGMCSLLFQANRSGLYSGW
jgi:hypothetical protein